MQAPINGIVLRKNAFRCHEAQIGSDILKNTELNAIVQSQEYDFLRTNKHLGKNILFLTLSGSHAYGTNVEGSDIDIRGAAGSPDILGFNHFEQVIDNKTDTVIFAIGKFVSLAAQNKLDDFSLSISEDEDEDGKHPLLISGNMSNYPVTSLKSMLKGLCTTIEQYEKPQNPKALKDAVHINKHAMHIVRLYYTAFDILEQGKIITRRDKEHEELLAIRNGKYMREDGTYEPAFFDMVDSFEARFQKAVKESVLPAKPDMQKIEELLVAINKSYLSRTM